METKSKDELILEIIDKTLDMLDRLDERVGDLESKDIGYSRTDHETIEIRRLYYALKDIVKQD